MAQGPYHLPTDNLESRSAQNYGLTPSTFTVFAGTSLLYHTFQKSKPLIFHISPQTIQIKYSQFYLAYEIIIIFITVLVIIISSIVIIKCYLFYLLICYCLCDCKCMYYIQKIKFFRKYIFYLYHISNVSDITNMKFDNI